jgi:hypothetical protein
MAEAEAARRRAADEAALRMEQEERDLKARWESLPEADRRAIEAGVKAENPGIDRFRNMLLPLCLEVLRTRDKGDRS